jgi:large subunit ribosomal protein L25
MAKQAKLKVEIREEAPQVVRRDDKIPAILYGYGLENTDVQVDRRSFATIFNEAGHTSLIDLEISSDKEAKPHTVLIHAVQMHPVQGTFLHVDFYQPRLDQKITAQVPLKFIGEAPAAKDLGGVLVRTLEEIEVEALPTDLPHDIEVDISILSDFEKAIHVKDLVLPDKVQLNHESSETVALVQPPRTEEEMEALEEEVSEDVESVEGVEDKEEEGEEGEGGDKEKTEDTETSKEDADSK